MAKYLVSFEVEANEEDLENLKKLEHHAEYLLDLDNWPEIKRVSNLQVQEEKEDPDVALTTERLKNVFTSYVNYDAEGTYPAYIREVLTNICGLTDAELRALGMDWVILEEDDE